jgi:hypothetical protein
VDTQNHFYSHSAVLAEYCGLRRPRHMRGLLQHGWTAISPVSANFGDFSWVDGRGSRRLFVWSHESRAWDPAQEPSETVALGAPWLYLHQLAGSPAPRGTDAPTVVLPIHGTRVMRWQGDHAGLAQQVHEQEGRVLVSVHHEDLDDPDIVGGWRSAGHEVVSSGARQDVAFLPRQMSLFTSAGRVVSNRLSTAIFYAAALGIPVAVYGDPFTITGGDREAYESVRERWPEFHGEQTDTAVTTQIARRELGAASVRQPAELRALLGWDRPVSLGAGADYWLRGPVEKALRVLGVRERVSGGQGLEVGLGAGAWLRHPFEHLPSRLERGLPPVHPLPEPLRPGTTPRA